MNCNLNLFNMKYTANKSIELFLQENINEIFRPGDIYLFIEKLEQIEFAEEEFKTIISTIIFKLTALVKKNIIEKRGNQYRVTFFGKEKIQNKEKLFRS